MKKLFAALLCVVMVLSMFAACNQNTPATTTAPKATNPPATSGKDPVGTTAPQTTAKEEPTPITIALPISANVQDYDTNLFTLWLEEETNTEITFMKLQTAAADYKSQLSTMFLDPGAQHPDMYVNINIDALYNQYGEDGYFLDLAPYFADKEKSAIWYDRMATLEAYDKTYHDLVVRKLYNENGAAYAFPTVEVSFGDTVRFRPYINQDWLTKLNLEMPHDLESLYKVLVAFRDGDPNGNGKKDEIPLLGRMDGGNSYPTDWFINMFCWQDEFVWVAMGDDGNVYLPHVTDKYREAIIYLRKLHDEGLFSDAIFAMKSADMKSLINVPTKEEQTVGIVVGHSTTHFDLTCDAVQSYVAVPYWGTVPHNTYGHSYRQFISAYTEYPDKCWEIMMVRFSKEGGFRMRYGIPGEHWVEPEPGAKTSSGAPAAIARKPGFVDWWGTVQNVSWSSMGGCSSFYEIDFGTVFNEDPAASSYNSVWRTKMCHRPGLESAQAAIKKNNPIELPPIVYTQAQKDETADVITNCQNFLKSARASFICGTGDQFNNPSDDAQWAAYIAELDKMGAQTWIKQCQSIYEGMGY